MARRAIGGIVTLHYAPASSSGELRDGRMYCVGVTRCARVEERGHYFTTDKPTCAECRANLGSVDLDLWRVHLFIVQGPR